MITANKISKIYGAGETACTALNDVSLTIGDTDIIAITGQSGSGKSTLINVLSTLDTPTDGTVIYNKKDMNNQTLYGWLKEFCEKNDMPFYGIHSFRHINQMKTLL